MTSYISTQENRFPSAGMLILGLASVLAGITAVVYTWALLAAAAGLGLFIIVWFISRRLQLWQALVAVSLTGFIVLNYGFENLVTGRIGGIPILIGESMMFAGMVLAIRKHDTRELRRLFQDPIVLCLIFLLMFSALHLIVDVPRFGLYAFRDASQYIEAMFLVAGYLWANEKNGIRRFIQWLLVIFALNAIYSFTLPWSEGLQNASPTSGVFQPITILGQYQHCALYLVAGALYCAWLADYTARGRRWILFGAAAFQLCGLAILQARSMFVGTAAVLAILLFLKERQKLRRSLWAIGSGLIVMFVLFFMISASGISISGRVGEINGDFLEQYALSVLSIDNSNKRLGKDDDRLDWYDEVWQGTTTDVTTFFIGQGFGQPLIDFENENGIPVRQPHNAAVGAFGRLGAIGIFVWLLVQALLVMRFLRALKAEKGREAHDLLLWLLVFYVLAFVLSMAQPALEFSHYAVPLYFIVGFSLRLMHAALEKPRTRTRLERSRYEPEYEKRKPRYCYNELG
jgi:hypothetical protein